MPRFIAFLHWLTTTDTGFACFCIPMVGAICFCIGAAA